MPLISISELDDPRLWPYRQVKGKQVLRGGEYLIAEGVRVTERLLASSFEAHSVLITERRVPSWEGSVPPQVPVYVVPEAMGSLLIGFAFHAGVMGCGLRRPSPPLEQVLPRAPGRSLVVVCPNCERPENLGAIIRIAAAFGADGLLLGPACCDPFSRRVLRVSMGTAFRLPIYESRDMERDLRRLRDEHDYELLGAVLSDRAKPLAQLKRPERVALLLGNEAHGLSDAERALCQREVTIPMAAEVDSLNIAIAAGIFLHQLTSDFSCRETE